MTASGFDTSVGRLARAIIFILSAGGVVCTVFAALDCQFYSFRSLDGQPFEGLDPPFASTVAGDIGMFSFRVTDSTDPADIMKDCQPFKYNFEGMDIGNDRWVAAQYCSVISMGLSTCAFFINAFECVCLNCYGSYIVAAALLFLSFGLQGATFMVIGGADFCFNPESQIECKLGETSYYAMAAIGAFFFGSILLCCAPRPEPMAGDVCFKEKERPQDVEAPKNAALAVVPVPRSKSSTPRTSNKKEAAVAAKSTEDKPVAKPILKNSTYGTKPEPETKPTAVLAKPAKTKPVMIPSTTKSEPSPPETVPPSPIIPTAPPGPEPKGPEADAMKQSMERMDYILEQERQKQEPVPPKVPTPTPPSEAVVPGTPQPEKEPEAPQSAESTAPVVPIAEPEPTAAPEPSEPVVELEPAVEPPVVESGLTTEPEPLEPTIEPAPVAEANPVSTSSVIAAETPAAEPEKFEPEQPTEPTTKMNEFEDEHKEEESSKDNFLSGIGDEFLSDDSSHVFEDLRD